MASSSLLKLASALFVLIVLSAPNTEAAINCGVVSRNMAQCIGYLTGAPGPSGQCCGGIKSLLSLAATPTDRKTACTCLKSAAGSIRDLDYGKAAGLPGKCGVRIPYAISPNTDCSKVN